MAISDDFFGPAYIDVDEWRDEPVRYRYVHGGFEGTDTRFSFYLPPAELYEGRMLQFLEGGPGGQEATALGADRFVADIEHAFDCGAYLVESNQGHLGLDLSGAKDDPSIICWRASAEAARYSKQVAGEMYGEPPHHSYIYGGSGGGVRSLKCLEMVDDVWDGGVPFVMPHASQGNFFSIVLNALRVLQPVLADISDAIEVGGSGRPFEGLTAEQADALAALYKAGFPRNVALDNPLEAVLVFTWFTDLFDRYDPTYFEEFWSIPGYLGHDHPEALSDTLIDIETVVTGSLGGDDFMTYQPAVTVVDKYGIGDMARLVGAIMGTKDARAGIKVADGDTSSMGCASVTVLTGAAAGREVNVIGVIGDVIVGSAVGEGGSLLFTGVEPGDRVRISNRKYLAFCFHHRHQVEAEYPEWGHFAVDGEPLYPQRPLLEKLFSAPYTYDVGNKKMIIVQNMLDRGTWPCGAVRYEAELRRRLGDAADQMLRVWFVEHAQHVPATMLASTGHPEVHAQLIDYEGYVQQALRDLIDWVEFGKEPLPSDEYTYSPDNAVILAAGAEARRGIQPVVRAQANGDARAEVGVGETVTFDVAVEMPAGAGRVVSLEWDPEGNGSYPVRDENIDGTQSKLSASLTHTFETPGTRFPTVRVAAHRSGDTGARFERLMNLGRTRVTVS
jgi:hypothetical protein